MKRISIIITVFTLMFLTPVQEILAKQNIQPYQTYTYAKMKEDLVELDEQYGDLVEVYSIGETPYNRELYLVKLGFGKANAFYNGSHHAREWITTTLNMKMIDTYASAYNTNSSLGGYNVKELLHKTTIWFVPMVNPDGVTLQQVGLDAFPSSVHEQLIQMNEGSTNFKRWKANAQGIDLNRQYPVGWETAHNAHPDPNWRNYKGTKPFEAEEAKVMRDITHIIHPDLSLAYHTAGRVLYWNFGVDSADLERDRAITEKYATLAGYQMVHTNSGAGYTDWINGVFDKPGITPELGYYVGETEVKPDQFSEIWRRNKHAGLAMAAEASNVSNKNTQTKDREKALFVDGAVKDALLPNSNETLYKQAQNAQRKLGLSLEQTVELYSWYQKCGDSCSVKDTSLKDIFHDLQYFTNMKSKQGIKTDHAWTVTFATDVDKESIHQDNIYVLNEQNQKVALQDFVINGNRVEIKPPKGNYESGRSYTIYVKEIQAPDGKVMKKPVQMQFTTQ
ncbi:M14 family metallopeptidase [Pontibacillus marinus]|uniref:Peptidase M14 domain-containing protein n=1 Tax=Pontibacillus marinus BH030004 = DSM 16465 TaxID=1385511 RepID=A0A0A5FYD7_9BACI|nr:M14 family metallocarboxypeptidase [Pontibacillus marinus]KGX85831.1 hypothetical protein N783_13790 [Pontibacillus marinus BH030004 = DSM 16465]